MELEQASDRWIYRCDCGWSSERLPFPDPDAALHAGRLHDAATHPERIDWDAEIAKMKRRYGLV